MLSGLIQLAIRHRGFVIGLIFLSIAGSVALLPHLTFDVVPDISNVQVQVLTQVPNLAPEESEASITRPLELEFGGIPGLEETRSLTTFGISQIMLIFKDGVDFYRARQLVQERITTVANRIPPGFVPQMAPPSNGLGEIYTYALRYRSGTESNLSAKEKLIRLKTLQDFFVRPALRTVDGIVEVNTTGGYDKQFLIEPDPKKVFDVGMDFNDLAVAIQNNVAVGSGSILNTGDHQTIVRSRARAQTIPDLEGLAVKLGWGSVVVHLNEIAHVESGTKIRTGAATLNGEETVLGTAMMLAGESGRDTAIRFKQRVREIQASLPTDVEITSLYDRADIVGLIMNTVRDNLAIAALFVAAVLLVFLRSWRAALITTCVIPIAFLFGISGMSWLGVSGNLMSLGAIDFGLIVDGAVVIVDNIVLSFARRQRELGRPLDAKERAAVASRASIEVAPPMVVGWLIILMVYLPVFAFSGVEAKLFQPMALAALLALGAALPLSLTLVPILCATFLRGALSHSRAGEKGLRFYLLVLEFAVRRRALFLSLAALIILAASVLATRLGLDFIPDLDEGWTVLETNKPAAINLEESLQWELGTENAILKRIPEVKQVYSRIGFSDVATDPQSPNQNDIYISYNPRNTWNPVDGRPAVKSDIEKKIAAAIEANVPGQELESSQPIRVRLDEMLEGVRSALAIKIFANDQEQLEALAGQVRETVETVRGVAETVLEPIGRVPYVEFEVSRKLMAQYLLTASAVDQDLAIGLAGREVGRVDAGEQFFPIVVRMNEPLRDDPGNFLNIPVRSVEGTFMLTLGQIGFTKKTDRLNSIFHENGLRRRAVMVNFSGRDLNGFVSDVKGAIASSVKLPEGAHIEYGGRYRNLGSALARLAWIIPVTLCLIFVMVVCALRSLSRALIVYTGVPFALVGGIAGLWIQGMPLTISALIGLIAVAGIAILNKLVFIDHYARLRRSGVEPWEAIVETTRNRIRPVLATALVASLGFLPMAFSTHVGAEVQRPIAVVVIGGLVTSTLLTLIVLPLLLTPFGSKTGGRQGYTSAANQDRSTRSEQLV
jgi:cobalt-zinc-cadmium resistance protein CzcA